MPVLRRQQRLWRLGKAKFNLFSGIGAALNGARWNSPGSEVIYAADSLAGAVLEVRVHLDDLPLPGTHGYIWIDVPRGVSYERLNLRRVPDWREDQGLTQRFGDQWVQEARSCLLYVPSVVTTSPVATNVLVNPQHPDFAKLSHLDPPEAHQWDPRLFNKSK